MRIKYYLPVLDDNLCHFRSEFIRYLAVITGVEQHQVALISFSYRTSAVPGTGGEGSIYRSGVQGLRRKQFLISAG